MKLFQLIISQKGMGIILRSKFIHYYLVIFKDMYKRFNNNQFFI